MTVAPETAVPQIQPDLELPRARAPYNRARIPAYLPLLLSLPALIPLLWAWIAARANGMIFTGFISYDLPYYLANARQHFARGFEPTFSNPYAPYGSPAIYFQPQTFLLALLDRLGFGPALALNLFGLAAMAFASIVAARLYEEVVGWETTAQKLGFLCFFWGGGVLALAGVLFGSFTGVPVAKATVLFDAGDGWWMFNFGRNLVYPFEAYYHGVFLLTLLMLIRKRHARALALTVLMAISHPFTGLSLGLIVAAFSLIEAVFTTREGWWKLTAGAAAVVAGHAAYYLVFLNRFADHRALQQQWELDWPYLAWTFGPAVYLVGFLAFLRLSRWESVKVALADSSMRLFLVCFAVIFGLSHHDAFMKSRQPLHFAHGYDWIALFFIASPLLIRLLERLFAISRSIPRMTAVLAFLLIMLSDNLLWFSSFRDPQVQRHAIVLTRDQDEMMRWLRRNDLAGAVVFSEDDGIGYLVPTYTAMRSHYGHTHNTPHAADRKREVAELFRRGETVQVAGAAYYIPLRGTPWTPPGGARKVYSNGTYIVWLNLPEGSQTASVR